MAHWKEKIKENIFEEVSLTDLIICWVKNQAKDQAPKFEKQNQFSELFSSFSFAQASSKLQIRPSIISLANQTILEINRELIFSIMYLNRI